MKQPSARQLLREARKKKEQRRKVILYSGIGVAVVAVVALIIVMTQNAANTQQVMGDVVPISSSTHIPADTVPGPYASNAPAGGTHFDQSWTAKFYEESDLAALPAHPEGYLVHSLEHGYVIFWYNCQVTGTDCTALKQAIQDVMDTAGGTKLIAFPWADMNVPLAMTSWGRILEFPQVDTDLMTQFVLGNRYKSPEPDGP